MNNGSVIEKGTHSELLAAGGFYADLYNSQFTGGTPGGTFGVQSETALAASPVAS
jgi:ATP-binding cassette subfamily B protein